MYVIKPGFVLITDDNEAEIWRVLAKTLNNHELQQALKQLPSGRLRQLPVSVLHPDESLQQVFDHLNIRQLGEITAQLTTHTLREYGVPDATIQAFVHELARFSLSIN